MCLLSDGTTPPLQANGTHKNQTGQAEGGCEHTRTRSPARLLFISPCLFYLFITLSFLCDPL